MRRTILILTRTFWIIMAIHVIVFTLIGISTGKWFFLIIFIPAVIATLSIKWLLTRYAMRHPEKKRLRQWLLKDFPEENFSQEDSQKEDPTGQK